MSRNSTKFEIIRGGCGVDYSPSVFIEDEEEEIVIDLHAFTDDKTDVQFQDTNEDNKPLEFFFDKLYYGASKEGVSIIVNASEEQIKRLEKAIQWNMKPAELVRPLAAAFAGDPMSVIFVENAQGSIDQYNKDKVQHEILRRVVDDHLRYTLWNMNPINVAKLSTRPRCASGVPATWRCVQG